MNAPKIYANTSYRAIMKQYADTMKRPGGSSGYCAACDTLQFEDYARYQENQYGKQKI